VALLAICTTLVSSLVYFSTLKMGSTFLCETSAEYFEITRRYISEDRTRYYHRYESLNLQEYNLLPEDES
jgi:hypothetical protein